MKHVFIVNPISGRGAANRAIPLIEEYFQENSGEYEIIVTEAPGHAKELASRYTKDDDVCVYATGGDGTLWEVVNGINDGVVMSIIPCGTGNDFFRMFDASILDIKKLLKDTIEGEVMAVDYGICNEKTRFINCLCIGLDADINATVNTKGRDSLVPKKMLYATTAVKAITKPVTLSFTIKNADEVQERQGVLVAIMNGRKYGGGFTPTPTADITDGLLDICLVKPLPFNKLIRLLPKYFNGTHIDLPVVECMNAEEIELVFASEVNVSLDGEVFRMDKIRAQIVKHGLLVKAPKESYRES